MGRFEAGVRPYREMGYYEPGYEPRPEDFLCAFRIKPQPEVEMEEAAAAVAAESSTGTWTDVWSKEMVDLERLNARVYRIEGDMAYIAYPPDLFEAGSIPNFLSSVVGNVFGFKAVQALRLEDVRFPPAFVRSFKGPVHGIPRERERLKKFGRPLLGGTIKPKLGLAPKDFARVVYESLRGGLDTTKDDENLNSQPFCPWQDRFLYVMEAVKRAEAETGEAKGHYLNVTAPTVDEMLRRAEFAAELGSRFIMVDFLTVGFTAFQTLRDHCERLGLILHCHRAMHAVMTRHPEHGINFRVLAKLVRLIGGDHLHTGTVVGKLGGTQRTVKGYVEVVRAPKVIPDGGNLFEQDWAGLPPLFPTASGGIHVWHVPFLVHFFGDDVYLLFGGGTHGHPGGSRAGASANRAAVEALVAARDAGRDIVAEGPQILEAAARHHPELRAALDLWRETRFLDTD